MTNQDVLKMCEKAFKDNKVKELLLGTDGFTCLPDKSVPASIPTDWSRIFEEGIYKLTDIPLDDIRSKLTSALMSLLEGNEVEVWVAFSVYFEQFYNERKNIASFKFINDELSLNVSNAIKFNEIALRQCKKWQGINFENGLLEDIITANKSLNDIFGESLSW